MQKSSVVEGDSLTPHRYFSYDREEEGFENMQFS
jgi:hypothetical protein